MERGYNKMNCELMLTYDTPEKKCNEKYLGTDGRTEVKQYTLLRWSEGIEKTQWVIHHSHSMNH